MQKYNK